MIRLRAGVNYALLEASGDGHCGLPSAELLKLAGELLSVERPSGPVEESGATSRVPMEPGLIQSALDLELAEGSVVADTLAGEPAILLAHLHRDERRIAEALQALNLSAPPWGSIEAAIAIPWVEQRLALELAASQKGAVEQALSSKVLVITGGPGVGKTTLINAILRIMAAKKLRILLCAPTGRAAKRMGETTGLEAKTIHRLLEFDPAAFGFKRKAELPLECDLLVVDETSMVNVPLMASLLDALPAEAALLLVGDVDQLPSVGPGQVLADLINSGALPVARLTEVFRQAASSRIITTAHAINAGTIPDLRPPPAETTSDFYFLPADSPEQAVALILKVVGERIPARFGLDPIAQVQVLCPMARGGCGSRSLNIELQQLLNPDPTEQVERFGWRFAPADKVMQVANDYEKEVFNGDVGTVETIDADASELTVRFPSGESGSSDGREVTYGWGELDNLVPAYACTIHKSQGSEYPAVVIPLLTQHYAMLQRNLVYTGINPRQAAGGAGGAEESTGDGGEEPPKPPALHQVGGVARLSSGNGINVGFSCALVCAAQHHSLTGGNRLAQNSSTLKQVFRKPAATATSTATPLYKFARISLQSTRPSSTYQPPWCSIRPSGRKLLGT